MLTFPVWAGIFDTYMLRKHALIFVLFSFHGKPYEDECNHQSVRQVENDDASTRHALMDRVYAIAIHPRVVTLLPVGAGPVAVLPPVRRGGGACAVPA